MDRCDHPFSNDNPVPEAMTYIADLDGRLIACEQDKWSDFCARNGATHLASGVGLNIFASCADPETASAYRLMHSVLQHRLLDRYSFDFRCDSPERTRLFRMTMTWYPAALPQGTILYQSQLLMERERTPVALLGVPSPGLGGTQPITKLCSFCQRAFDAAARRWVEAEQHPAAHDADARTAHGICPDCHDAVVAPLVAVLTRAPAPSCSPAG